jgi:xanthosine utilization system XapX-like protein
MLILIGILYSLLGIVSIFVLARTPEPSFTIFFIIASLMLLGFLGILLGIKKEEGVKKLRKTKRLGYAFFLLPFLFQLFTVSKHVALMDFFFYGSFVVSAFCAFILIDEKWHLKKWWLNQSFPTSPTSHA